MHRLVIVALVLFIAAGPAAAQELKTDQDKALYALGVSLGSRLGPFALTAAELEFVKAGLADGALGKTQARPPARTGHRSSSSRARAPPRWRPAEKKAGEAVPGQGGRREGRQAAPAPGS